ncbi:anaphase-promoting complex, subunit 10/DOC domain-containing protein [Phycomyces nitens]|nr:anaphase-promoting complex, subunit 10/DOC domain-containing protein [Phycomyces nitens]
MREITDEDSLWSVSTRRLTWGVENLRDNNPLTYWFSDCPNQKGPHTIDIVFGKPTWIKQVSLFIDYFQDNSYTPWIISIRGGTCYRDMQEIVQIECEKAVGWQHADLEDTGECTRVFRLQIAILSTHENGRDTHVRQAKVYSIPG